MAGIGAMALFYMCITAEISLVLGCMRFGPSNEDFSSLKGEIQLIKKELHNLESKHENFVSESRSRKLNTGTTVTPGVNQDISSLLERLDELEERQKELEEQTASGEATKLLIKKMLDTLEMQINGKIETMNDALSKMEKTLNEDHVALENSIETLEKVMKDKLKEFHKQLTDNTESTQEKHDLVFESIHKLNTVVNSDLKGKVDDFDKHITTIRTAKEEADTLLTELQTVVEKIRPNTFNKESAVKAFLVLVAFVLFLGFWMYKIQQNVTELKKCQ